ncbi:MAG: helix-turn-helix transcriptional regulator [Liquorilactobacillus hordei]|uniref:helix-turn-helix domain-containing protein n=1 Tax=Liquorilactobacillus hordei TaxID=468911 RepID=UPI0039EAE066
MNTLEVIKQLAKERNMSVYELEETLGFGKNTIYQWSHRTPSIERVKKVADYFGVSLDYLTGRTSKKNISKIDLANVPDGVLTFEGKTIPEDELEIIRHLLRNKPSNK